MPDALTYACFTNAKNIQHVFRLFGAPKEMLVWEYGEGQWVSHNRPLRNCEHILIYGQLRNDAYKGEHNTDRTPMKKGKGCIGRDKKLGDRVYTPRPRKMLKSVIHVSRNVGKELGIWSKPYKLAKTLMEYLTNPGERVWDGFAGSGTFGVVAKEMGVIYEGYEINKETCIKTNSRILNHNNQSDEKIISRRKYKN